MTKPNLWTHQKAALEEGFKLASPFIQVYLKALEKSHPQYKPLSADDAEQTLGYMIREDEKYKGKMRLTKALTEACEAVGIPATWEAIKQKLKEEEEAQNASSNDNMGHENG